VTWIVLGVLGIVTVAVTIVAELLYLIDKGDDK
jgi:hypothetical protein